MLYQDPPPNSKKGRRGWVCVWGGGGYHTVRITAKTAASKKAKKREKEKGEMCAGKFRESTVLREHLQDCHVHGYWMGIGACNPIFFFVGCSTVVLMFHLSGDNSRDRCIKGSCGYSVE